MNLEIEGKKALVTGGSRGIGFAIAKRLAAEGCEVRLVARDAAALEAARARILAVGRAGVSVPIAVPVTVHAADLGDPAQLERVFPLLQDVDILVNSAGAVPRGTVFEVSAETFRAAFAAKVMGAIDLSRETLRHMCARRSGVIVNIIGLSGERPNPRSVATSTANAALMAFTQAVGASSVDDNVRVLGVNPGLIATERTASLTDASDPVNSMAYRHLIEALPYGRMGTPEEVADVVAFLVSPRATYMSGTVVTVDAGSHFRV